MRNSLFGETGSGSVADLVLGARLNDCQLGRDTSCQSVPVNYSEAPTIPESRSSLEKSSVDVWRRGEKKGARAKGTKRIEKYESEVHRSRKKKENEQEKKERERKKK